MLITVQLTGQESAREVEKLQSMIAGLYGGEPVAATTDTVRSLSPELFALAARAGANLTDEPAPEAIFKPAPGAESAAPLEEPSPAAVFTAAPPAPIAPAPVGIPAAPVPAPVVSASSTAVELDAEGIPWDGRIHASTKTKTAKNVWKALRGLNDDGKVARIKAELRAALSAPPAAAAPVPVPPSFPPVAALPAVAAAAVPVPPGAGAGTVPPAPGAVAAVPSVSPVAAPPAPNGEVEAVTTFPQIMKKISSLRVGQFPIMSQDELTNILAAVSLPSLPSLAARVDLVPEVNAHIDAFLMTKRQ